MTVCSTHVDVIMCNEAVEIQTGTLVGSRCSTLTTIKTFVHCNQQVAAAVAVAVAESGWKWLWLWLRLWLAVSAAAHVAVDVADWCRLPYFAYLR